MCWQAFIPKALNELARVDVINQQADFGREADFKLGNKEEREAKACACSLSSRELPCSSCEQGTHTRFCSQFLGTVQKEEFARAQAQTVRCRGPTPASPS